MSAGPAEIIAFDRFLPTRPTPNATLLLTATISNERPSCTNDHPGTTPGIMLPIAHFWILNLATTHTQLT